MNEKEELINYFRNFSEVTVSGICRDLGLSKANIFKGTASLEKMKLVKKEIEKRVAKLYIGE